MKRTAELVELAKDLYCHEQLTFKEIARRLGVNDRTIRTWKSRDSQAWEAEREAFLASKRGLHEELYEFSRELIQSIRNDFKAGEKVEQTRVSCLNRILPLIFKPKDYEEVVQQRRDEDTQSEKTDLAAIIAQVMEIGGHE